MEMAVTPLTLFRVLGLTNITLIIYCIRELIDISVIVFHINTYVKPPVSATVILPELIEVPLKVSYNSIIGKPHTRRHDEETNTEASIEQAR